MTTRKPRNMGEHRLGALRMMLGRADAGAVRRAQHHRTGEPSLGAVTQSGGVVHQLVDAGIDKAHELDLADGLQPLRRHADAEAADQEFGKRRIEHALRSEALLQAGGRAEDAAVDADVFAKHDAHRDRPPSRGRAPN